MDGSGGTRGRLAALGTELIEVHHWLRQELATLREDLDRHLRGRGERPRDLRAHCLSFCAALERHHTGEDRGAFPALAERFPELRPVITQLEEDHWLVADILRRLEALLAGVPEPPEAADAARVLGELDGLAAIMESHFAFEERKIVAALDSLPPDAGSAADLFGLAAPDGG